VVFPAQARYLLCAMAAIVAHCSLGRRSRRRSPVHAHAAVLLCSVLLAAGSALGAQVYRIDAVHSTLLFRIRHLGISYAYGRFRDVSGTLQLDAADPEQSKVRVEIGAASIDTGNEKRDQHLRSADYFDVERFPSISFTSTRVRKQPDDLYAITGDLTLHGVTRSVTVYMKLTGAGPDPWGGERAGIRRPCAATAQRLRRQPL
jgi:polyisoprenoid-binding protein YceI